jgi:site-specific DNA-methyltransferase (adenine-specific)
MKLSVKNGEMWHGDCLELMKDIPSGSVDMILCDLPYGTTQNKWDIIIPFEPLWMQYWRIAKSNAAIVLTSAQPFTSAIVMSQITKFKYDWSWNKTAATGHLNAKIQPMRNHEDILIFGNKIHYNPQGLTPYNKMTRRGNNGTNFNVSGTKNFQENTNYPRSRIEFANDGKLHPTQKPVALFEYLIKTYTNEGALILDNCIGSGTTAIAAENTGRKWIGIEKEFKYYSAAFERVCLHK